MLKYALQLELIRNDKILAKCLNNHVYAQNLYAAMCNNKFYKINDLGEFLDSEYWSASWRAAGQIVADMRNVGEDYMDFYCSGISSDDAGMVPEGFVTNEIREDLLEINWVVKPYENNSKNNQEGL